MRDRDRRMPAPNTLSSEVSPPKKSSRSNRLVGPASVGAMFVLMAGTVGVASIIKESSDRQGAQQALERRQKISDDSIANLERLGLSGEIPLLDFMIATTQIEGQEPVQELLFSWQQNESSTRYISDLPLDRVRFNIDDAIERPTIAFQFNPRDFVDGNLSYPDDPNRVMDRAKIATVTITQEGFNGLLQQTS